MPKVNAKARIRGLKLAVWFWGKDKAHMPQFNYRDLESSGTLEKVEARYSADTLTGWIRNYAKGQEAFCEGFMKPDDRLYGSDVIDAYDWYVAVFRAHDAIPSLGITAEDFGIDEGRWDSYLNGTTSLPEGVQNCINVACEMKDREGAKAVYVKLLKSFGFNRQVGFIHEAWKGSLPLPEIVGAVEAPAVDGKPVVCCFTVPAEVAEWLRGKKNMSRFISDLVREEMEAL